MVITLCIICGNYPFFLGLTVLSTRCTKLLRTHARFLLLGQPTFAMPAALKSVVKFTIQVTASRVATRQHFPPNRFVLFAGPRHRVDGLDEQV